MTTGEQLDLISTVSNTSALQHLLNPSGTGGGSDQWFPYTDLSVSFEEETLDVSFDSLDLVVDLVIDDLDVSFDDEVLSVTFDDDTNDIILTC